MQPTKTLSARFDLLTHTKVQKALRPGEKMSDFVAAAVASELARRRTEPSTDVTLAEVGQMTQASLAKAALSQSMLGVIDSKLTRLLQEMDVNL